MNDILNDPRKLLLLRDILSVTSSERPTLAGRITELWSAVDERLDELTDGPSPDIKYVPVDSNGTTVRFWMTWYHLEND